MTSTQEESNEDLIKLVFDYARKNIIHMKVFFKRPYYTEIRRDLQMTTISFIGTIGGLASLCLGLSWISIVEILYHCFCSFARFAGKRFWNTKICVFHHPSICRKSGVFTRKINVFSDTKINLFGPRIESQTGHFSIWIFGAKNKLFDVKNETILELLAMFVYFNAQKKSIFITNFDRNQSN